MLLTRSPENTAAAIHNIGGFSPIVPVLVRGAVSDGAWKSQYYAEH